jgi:hypothetical protein
VIPFEGVEDELLRHVPARLAVTVSASQTRGLEPTLVLCERLVEQGYRAVPHLAARLGADAARRARADPRRRRARGLHEWRISPDLESLPNHAGHLGGRRPRRAHEYGGNVTQSAMYIIALCRFGAHVVGRRARGSRTMEEPDHDHPL